MLDWIIAHPNAATALATMALVAVGLLVGTGQIGVIWVGIRAMDRSSAQRKADRDAEIAARQAEHAAWKAERDAAREESRRRYEADERRHEEVMTAFARDAARADEDGRRRDEEALRRHEESMAALKALIERTAPRPAAAD